MPPLDYSPLDLKSRHIRLVRILPGKRGSIIRCKLSECSLAAPEPYTALSYTWGSPGAVASATVEGDAGRALFQLPIGQTLFDALENFRSETDDVVMGIDAICIDQSNIVERNHQVKLMRWIYQRARRVLVWLGPPTVTSDRAMHQLELLADVDWAGMAESDWSRYDTEAIAELICRPWFSRVWVRQEVRMSPLGACSVRCGESVLDILVFKRFVEKLCAEVYGGEERVLRERWGRAYTHGGPINSLVYCIPFEGGPTGRNSLIFWLWSSQSSRRRIRGTTCLGS